MKIDWEIIGDFLYQFIKLEYAAILLLNKKLKPTQEGENPFEQEASASKDQVLRFLKKISKKKPAAKKGGFEQQQSSTNESNEFSTLHATATKFYQQLEQFSPALYSPTHDDLNQTYFPGAEEPDELADLMSASAAKLVSDSPQRSRVTKSASTQDSAPTLQEYMRPYGALMQFLQEILSAIELTLDRAIQQSIESQRSSGQRSSSGISVHSNGSDQRRKTLVESSRETNVANYLGLKKEITNFINTLHNESPIPIAFQCALLDPTQCRNLERTLELVPGTIVFYRRQSFDEIFPTILKLCHSHWQENPKSLSATYLYHLASLATQLPHAYIQRLTATYILALLITYRSLNSTYLSLLHLVIQLFYSDEPGKNKQLLAVLNGAASFTYPVKRTPDLCASLLKLTFSEEYPLKINANNIQMPQLAFIVNSRHFQLFMGMLLNLAPTFMQSFYSPMVTIEFPDAVLAVPLRLVRTEDLALLTGLINDLLGKLPNLNKTLDPASQRALEFRFEIAARQLQTLLTQQITSATASKNLSIKAWLTFCKMHSKIFTYANIISEDGRFDPVVLMPLAYLPTPHTEPNFSLLCQQFTALHKTSNTTMPDFARIAFYKKWPFASIKTRQTDALWLLAKSAEKFYSFLLKLYIHYTLSAGIMQELLIIITNFCSDKSLINSSEEYVTKLMRLLTTYVSTLKAFIPLFFKLESELGNELFQEIRILFFAVFSYLHDLSSGEGLAEKHSLIIENLAILFPELDLRPFLQQLLTHTNPAAYFEQNILLILPVTASAPTTTESSLDDEDPMTATFALERKSSVAKTQIKLDELLNNVFELFFSWALPDTIKPETFSSAEAYTRLSEYLKQFSSLDLAHPLKSWIVNQLLIIAKNIFDLGDHAPLASLALLYLRTMALTIIEAQLDWTQNKLDSAYLKARFALEIYQIASKVLASLEAQLTNATLLHRVMSIIAELQAALGLNDSKPVKIVFNVLTEVSSIKAPAQATTAQVTVALTTAATKTPTETLSSFNEIKRRTLALEKELTTLITQAQSASTVIGQNSEKDPVQFSAEPEAPPAAAVNAGITFRPKQERVQVIGELDVSNEEKKVKRRTVWLDLPDPDAMQSPNQQNAYVQPASDQAPNLLPPIRHKSLQSVASMSGDPTQRRSDISMAPPEHSPATPPAAEADTTTAAASAAGASIPVTGTPPSHPLAGAYQAAATLPDEGTGSPASSSSLFVDEYPNPS